MTKLLKSLVVAVSAVFTWGSENTHTHTWKWYRNTARNTHVCNLPYAGGQMWGNPHVKTAKTATTNYINNLDIGFRITEVGFHTVPAPGARGLMRAPDAHEVTFRASSVTPPVMASLPVAGRATEAFDFAQRDSEALPDMHVRKRIEARSTNPISRRDASPTKGVWRNGNRRVKHLRTFVFTAILISVFT